MYSVHVCMNMCLCLCKYVCMCICMYVDKYVGMCMWTCVCVGSVYVSMYVYVYIYVCICVYVHMYMHAFVNITMSFNIVWRGEIQQILMKRAIRLCYRSSSCIQHWKLSYMKYLIQAFFVTHYKICVLHAKLNILSIPLCKTIM